MVSSPLPIVVQLGFSGSRVLVDTKAYPRIDLAVFHEEIQHYLTTRLASLPQELGLGSRHFLCGISQVAIGADTLFTRACSALLIPQRIFLPQHRDEYLDAKSARTSDFSTEDKTTALALLELPHIIEVRSVSDSANRAERFQDCQLETAVASDLLICLVRADATGKVGGALELLEIARKRAIPLLVIRISVNGNKPSFDETWHHRERFELPSLPRELDELTLPTRPHAPPDLQTYVGALKSFGTRLADTKRNFFKNIAGLIIGAHLLATICAVIAVILKDVSEVTITLILGIEVILLASGFIIHQYLHHSHACRIWAISRVIGEIARSVQAVGRHHLHLSYLFHLPFPRSLNPLLHTLNVLHLIFSNPSARDDWQRNRNEYLHKRLSDPQGGQMEYNRVTKVRAARQLKRAQLTFLTCSIVALAATLLKIAISSAGVAMLLPDIGISAGMIIGISKAAGFLAIVSPVLAVGALSLAAAFDLEARLHISEEMLADLEDLDKWMADATSEREFTRLLLETEARLLGETATWYSRRSFTGVA
jgi:hypothetical protein